MDGISYNDPTFLILEKIKGTSLYNLIHSVVKPTSGDIFSIIFQVLFTLQIFNIFGLRHNDLHLENILVQKNTTPTFYIYFITDTIYFAIPVNYCVKIFDFDFSATKEIKNYKLDYEGYCLSMGICNQKNIKYDLFVFLDSIRDATKNHFQSFNPIENFYKKCVNEKLSQHKFRRKHSLCFLAPKTKEEYEKHWELYNKEEEFLKLENEKGKFPKQSVPFPTFPKEGFPPVDKKGPELLGFSYTKCKGNWEPSDDYVLSIPRILMLDEFKKYRHTLPEFDFRFLPFSPSDLVHKNIFMFPNVNRKSLEKNMFGQKIKKVYFTK